CASGNQSVHFALRGIRVDGLAKLTAIQYFDGTNFRCWMDAWSSYAPFIERFGSFTFPRRTLFHGLKLRMWARQLRRARFLSSERRMYQGACSVSVAASIVSRAREYAYHRSRDGRSTWLSFHWRSGSSMRASNRRFCSWSPTSSQILMS